MYKIHELTALEQLAFNVSTTFKFCVWDATAPLETAKRYYCQTRAMAENLRAELSAVNATDQEFLAWIYDRLTKVHNENPNMDFMRKLSSLIAAMEPKPPIITYAIFNDGCTTFPYYVFRNIDGKRDGLVARFVNLEYARMAFPDATIAE